MLRFFKDVFDTHQNWMRQPARSKQAAIAGFTLSGHSVLVMRAVPWFTHVWPYPTCNHLQPQTSRNCASWESHAKDTLGHAMQQLWSAAFFLTWSCWVALEPCRSIIEFHKASRIIDIKSIDTHSSPIPTPMMFKACCLTDGGATASGVW